MRKFEKISFEQFKKQVKDDKKLYDRVQIPKRDSKATAGYDINVVEEFTINPGEIKKLPTGIKACFNDDEVLFLIDRSSTGFKYNIRMCNQVAVIDADYYNNPDNEGHLWIKIQNEGDKAVTFSEGDAVVQGVFTKYLTTDDDDRLDIERRSEY